MKTGKAKASHSGNEIYHSRNFHSYVYFLGGGDMRLVKYSQFDLPSRLGQATQRFPQAVLPSAQDDILHVVVDIILHICHVEDPLILFRQVVMETETLLVLEVPGSSGEVF